MSTTDPTPQAPAPLTRDDILEHLDDVRDWCVMRCGDPHLAEDVMQDTALTAMICLGALRHRECLRGWLFRIAERRLVDASRQRRGEVPLLIDPAARTGGPPFESWKVRQAQEALKKLPTFLRMPVRLHYLQGRPLREVALKLRTSVNGIKARLYRARRIMRSEVELAPTRGAESEVET